MRVVSRNCTEDGWSEPFPHYFDACGFDDYESETGDQVRVRLPPAGGGGGAEEVQARVFPPGALTAHPWDWTAGSPGPSAAFVGIRCVPEPGAGRGRRIHSFWAEK